MERGLESQLNELMMKNQKKFIELIEKATGNFKEKYNKEIYSKTKDRLRILDGSKPSDYFLSMEFVEDWIDKSIDEVRNHIKQISYPLFVYLYLELILKDLWQDGKFYLIIAKNFFAKFSGNFTSFKDELAVFELIKEPINFNNPLLSGYLKNKIHLFIPKTVFDFFIHFLNTNNLIIILDILNKYFERSNILSKANSHNLEGIDKFILLNLTGDEIEKINSRTGIYYSKIKKDNEAMLKLKSKGRTEKNTLGKYLIPIPESYYDNVPLEQVNLKIDKSANITIGCFTLLNTHNKMNCADMTCDGSILACGFKDGSIQVWIIDKDITIDVNDANYSKILSKKEQNMSDQNKNEENIQMKIDENGNDENTGAVFEEISKKQRKFKLLGHSDSIFSISISPDKKYVISGSYDETIRLWNVYTKTTLVLYKGHFAPVLSVKFSPFSHYFASGGSDRTAKLWSVNSPGPLRVFVGHLSDVELVDFHPNGLYLLTSAADRTIRMWALENGECVRIFFNYSNISNIDCVTFSNSGKILAVGCDKSIVLYDLVKMGDPIRIIENITQKSIMSISFDNEDSVITIGTEDYKILFYSLNSILNDDLSLLVNMENNTKIDLITQYYTKKTTILVTKFSPMNILILLGRFDDNDPKIFM